jgi:putative transposase
MSTGPKCTVAQAVSEGLQEQIEQAVAGGLGELTVRDLLGFLLSTLGEAERRAFLQAVDGDKGNGTYPRSVKLGSIPVEMEVPRTRRGGFRPTFLPEPYQRAYPEEMANLMLGLLAAGRSANAVKAALRRVGVGASAHHLEAVSQGLIQEFDLRNTRPIDPDQIAIFFDGKYVEIRDGERLRPACIYTVAGLDCQGKKHILSCMLRLGRETAEDWKAVLRSLIERGLRRVLIVVHDDLPGLLPISSSLFPSADVQLCIVHMQRNVSNHLSKTDSAEFQCRLRTIKNAWDPNLAAAQFDDLCTRFAKAYPTFVHELRKKRTHYLAFLKYPESLRRSFSTTNVAEAINGEIERIRRNTGGYFHSDHDLKLKLSLAASYLENGTWHRVPNNVSPCLPQLNAIFHARYEQEL